MKLQLLVLCGAVFAAGICEVRSLTNKQFYELVEPYLSESDVEDVTADTMDADDDIVLPGGPDDEVNFDYVIKQLGANSVISEEDSYDAEEEGDESAVDEMSVHEDSLETLKDSVEGGRCSCSRTGCSCCFPRTFRVGRRRIRVTIRHSLAVCYRVPYTFGLAKGCAQLYRLNFRSKSFCLKLYAQVWRYRVTFMRRCFRFATETNAPAIADKDFEGELEEYFGEH